MQPYYDDGQIAIYHADCREAMASTDANSVDAIVCDPPYGLEFMGKDWDKLTGEPKHWNTWEADSGRYHNDTNFLARGNRPRYGRNGAAMQEWHEAWLVEALRVAKPGGYLLAFGGTRTHHRLTCAIEDAGWEVKDCLMWLHGQGFPKHKSLLKPAWEPIVLAKKPGVLQIDACRIDFASDADKDFTKAHNQHGKWQSGEVNGYHGWESRGAAGDWNPPGRWPANVVLDEEAGAVLDAMSGERPSRPGKTTSASRNSDYGMSDRHRAPNAYVDANDTGGASRFFYCAKASRSERGEGNSHPTVKPLSLMRWLVRLVTPPGGTVLDPFAGSGTTLLAAQLEGRKAIGIELNEAYAEIAVKRLQQSVLPLAVA